MIRIVISLFFILFSGSLMSQKFEWAKQVGTSGGSDEVSALAITTNDTVVIGCGFFGGTLPGGIGSASGGKDVFVRGTNKGGGVNFNPLHFISTGANDAINDAVGSSNVSYVTGKLHGTLTGAVTVAQTYGAGSFFIAKINASGTADWVVPTTNNILSEGQAVTVDATGNIYVAGIFKGTMISGTDTITSQGINNDIFIYKYDANGNALWLKSINGAGNEEVVSLEYDNSNARLLVLGNFSQTIQLSGSAFLSPSSAGATNVFVAAYNTNGVLGVNTRPFYGNGNIKAADLVILSNSEIAIGGGYTIAITDGTRSFNSAGGEDIFIGKLNTTSLVGTALKSYGGISSERITQLEANANLFAFGEFGANLTFGSYLATSNSTSDIFLLSWNNALTEFSAHGSIAGPGSNVVTAKSMKLGSSRMYFSGQFRRIANFKNAGTFISRAVSFFDGYLASASAKEIYCPIDDSVSLATNLRVQGDSALLCFADSGQLSALGSSASFSYQWYEGGVAITGATSQNFQAKTTASYYLVISDNIKSCADTSLSIKIHVEAEPFNSITDTIVCDSTGQFLIALSPAYSPTNGGSLTGSPGINQSTGEFFSVFAGAGVDTLIYVYENAAGCKGSDTAIYEVRANPLITFTTLPIYCEKDPRDTLKFGSANVPLSSEYYEITGANAYGIEDSVVFRSDTLPPNQTPGHSVIYHAIDSLAGCESEKVAFIVINPIPNVVFNFSPPIPLCNNTLPFILTGGNQTGGVYSGKAVNSSNARYTPSSATSQLDTVHFSFVDNNGCADTASVALNIDSVPDVTFSFTTKICSSDSLITLTGGSPSSLGNGQYKSPWVSSGNFFPRLSGVGTHPVTYVFENLQGCKDSVTQNLAVNSLPGVSMAAVPPICENEKSRLITGGSPIGGVYSLRGQVLTNGLLDPSNFPALPGGAQDSVVYTYTDTNNCTSIGISSLLIRRLDGIVFNPALTLNRLCNNDSIDLFAMGDTLFSPPPANGGKFVDEYGDVISIFRGEKYLPPASDTSTLTRLQYIYDYSATGCSDTATKFLRISYSPVASIKPVAFACAGIDFEIEAQGGITYLWDNESTVNPLPIVQDTATKYNVTVTNINSCKDSASVLVSLSNGSIITGKGKTTDLKKGEDVTIDVLDNYPADTVELIGEITMLNTPTNAAEFYQEQGKKQDILSSVYYQPDPEYRRQDTVDYRVCDIVCTNICDTARLIFNVLGDPYDFIPNGFSPNGDGMNDTWVIPGIEAYPENELYIYNRWGDLIFEAAPYLNEWAGQANKGIGGSDKIGDGVFYYVLITNDGEPIKGSIEMKSN